MIVIDAYRGGNDNGYVYNNQKEKDFNLLISKYIYDRLNELNISTYITRENDISLNINQRSDLIKDAFGDNKDVILISNRLNNEGNDIEIVYSLKDDNTIANKLENEFIKDGFKVSKVYQRRDENDTSKDYDELLKRINNIRSIIIYYGNINNIKNISNNYKEYAESVIEVLTTLLGVSYNNNYITYIVKKNDNLYSISRKYNISINEIKNLNNLKSNIIYINQKLKIPIKKIYIVKKGDSLWKIANNYNTSINKLKEINNLNSNLLSINQKLVLP